MALDATVGGTAANSYVTLAAAETYLASRFGTEAWDALEDAAKEKALMQATRHIDACPLKGRKITSAQALEFPRTLQLQASSQLPPEVIRACCEEALWVARWAESGGRSPRQHMQGEGVTSQRMGQQSETFGRGSRAPLGPDAMQILARWIQGGARILTGRQTAAPAGPGWWPFS